MKPKHLNLNFISHLFINHWLKWNPFLIFIPGTLTILWAGLILIAAAIANPIHAQVIIKEKVEIDFSNSISRQ